MEIPTAVSLAEQQFLTELANDRLVYEAGALMGASTIALAKSARFVVSVDPHDGYPWKDPSPTWSRFRLNLRIAGVSHKVQPIRARFQDAKPDAKYGLAFADLTGARWITEEFLLATEHIDLVAIHDYARGGCSGATEAVDTFLHKHRRHVMRVGSLIVLEKE